MHPPLFIRLQRFIVYPNLGGSNFEIRVVSDQHLEMAMPVTELTAQQLGYFESESAHTLILRSMHVLKD